MSNFAGSLLVPGIWKYVIPSVVIAAGATSSFAQSTLFTTDQSDGDEIWTDANSAPNETGEAFRLGASGATLNGFDIDSIGEYNLQGLNQHFTDLHLLVTVFGGVEQTYNGSGGGAEFYNPEESVVYDLPLTWQNSSVFAFVGTPTNPYFTLPTPVSVPNGVVGMQFTWLGLIGGSYQPVSVEIGFNAFHAPLVGNNVLNWGGDEPEFLSFTATDSSTSISQNSYGGDHPFDNLDVTLYGSAAPEPGAAVLLGLGGATLLLRGRRTTR